MSKTLAETLVDALVYFGANILEDDSESNFITLIAGKYENSSHKDAFQCSLLTFLIIHKKLRQVLKGLINSEVKLTGEISNPLIHET